MESFVNDVYIKHHTFEDLVSISIKTVATTSQRSFAVLNNCHRTVSEYTERYIITELANGSKYDFIIFSIKLIHVICGKILIQVLYSYHKIALYVSCKHNKKALHNISHIIAFWCNLPSEVYKSCDTTWLTAEAAGEIWGQRRRTGCPQNL